MLHRNTWIRLLSIGIVLALVSGLAGNATVAQAQEPAARYPFIQKLAEAVISAAARATGLTEAQLLRDVLSGKTLAQIVEENGADPDAVRAGAKAALTADLEKAVADNLLTQAQANRLLGTLDQALDRVLGTSRARPVGSAARGVMNVLRSVLEATAEALDLTPQDLLRELGTPKTLTDLITARGGDVNAIKATVKERVTAEINNALTEGRISQAQADRLLAGLDGAIDRVFSSPLPGRAANVVLRQLESLGVNALIAETARQTGLTRRDLLLELRKGKTLSAIATEKQADPAKIVEAVQTQITERVNTLVQNTRLTQAQADELLSKLPERLNRLMNDAGIWRPGRLGRR